jgi:hypothetical protein
MRTLEKGKLIKSVLEPPARTFCFPLALRNNINVDEKVSQLTPCDLDANVLNNHFTEATASSAQ